MKKFFFALLLVPSIFFFSGCGSDDPVGTQNNSVKSLNKIATTYEFQNRPIEIFGDPEISRTYEDSEGVWFSTGSNPSVVQLHLNLTISNPQNVQFFINGSDVTYNCYYEGNNTWTLQYKFQSGISYTFTTRVTYSQHYNSSTCGTWDCYWDIIVG